MNDDLMSRLDDRGRSAGAAAHGAVAELPIPDFDPDLVRVSLDDDPTIGAAGSGGRGDRRWLAVVGIAAALLVVALGAALASRAGDDDSAPTDNVGTTTPVRPYVAGWLPQGLQVSHVVENEGRSDGEQVRLVLFGPSVDDPRLGIAAVSDSTPIEQQIAEGEESYRSIGTAGGRQVFTQEAMTPDTFVFDEGGQQVVIIPGDGVDEATVLEVAGAIELDGGEVTLADPPADWERLSPTIDPFSVGGGGGPVGGSSLVSYSGRMPDGPQDVPDHYVMVSSSPGTDLSVSAMRLLSHSSEDVVVRGHPAVLVRTDGGAVEGSAVPEWSVTWEENPGEILQVAGVGPSRDDLLAVAEDVRPASSAEMDDLARTAVLTPGPNESVVGSGQFSDGSPWALVVSDDGESDRWTSLRTSADGSDSAGASSGVGQAIGEDGEPIDSERPALPEVTSGGGGAFGWAYGLLDPTSGAAVTRVVVEDASGAVVAEAVLVGEGDVRGWVAELPAGLVPSDGDDAGSSSSSGSGSSGGSSDSSGSSSELPTTTDMDGGDIDEEVDGPTVVAYAADGTELARQPLP